MPVLFVGPEGDASELVRRSGAGIALCGSEEEDISELEAFASRADRARNLARMSEAAVDFMNREYSRKLMAHRAHDGHARRGGRGNRLQRRTRGNPERRPHYLQGGGA